MDQHAQRHGARAARSHGTVEPEHGATTDAPRCRGPQGWPA